MSSHTCPEPRCEIQVPSNQLACRPHWYSIPKPLRDELWAAYREDGQGSERHLAAVDACVAYLEGRAA